MSCACVFCCAPGKGLAEHECVLHLLQGGSAISRVLFGLDSLHACLQHVPCICVCVVTVVYVTAQHSRHGTPLPLCRIFSCHSARPLRTRSSRSGRAPAPRPAPASLRAPPPGPRSPHPSSRASSCPSHASSLPALAVAQLPSPLVLESAALDPLWTPGPPHSRCASSANRSGTSTLLPGGWTGVLWRRERRGRRRAPTPVSSSSADTDDERARARIARIGCGFVSN